MIHRADATLPRLLTGHRLPMALRCCAPRMLPHATTPFERIFVINLDRRVDRWTWMVNNELPKVRGQQPAELVERVSAVDGRAFTEESAVRALEAAGFLSHLGAARLLAPACDRVWGMDLTPGAVGCALSHIQLWTRIAAAGRAQAARRALCCADDERLVPLPETAELEDEPVFLVVEDDSSFPDDFLEVYTQLTAPYHHTSARVPPDWQLLYVGGLDTAQECAALVVDGGDRTPAEPGTTPSRQLSVCHVPQFHRTTHAYALKPSGARALLRVCLPLTYQIDTMMTLHATPDATARGGHHRPPYVRSPRCYTLQPPLATQRSEKDSDIQTLS